MLESLVGSRLPSWWGDRGIVGWALRCWLGCRYRAAAQRVLSRVHVNTCQWHDKRKTIRWTIRLRLDSGTVAIRPPGQVCMENCASRRER